MATVRIRIDDFEDGLVPGVCASSGVDGARLYPLRVSTMTPKWLWLCLFGGPAGIFVGFVLAGVLRKSASGYVPYLDGVHARLQARSQLALRWFVASLALLVGGLVLATVGEGFGGLGVIVMVFAVVAAVGAAFLQVNVPGSVRGYLDPTIRWVELGPVSSAFAAAYERQDAERRAARRADVIGTRQDR